jgi:hypothetical protein
MPPASFVTERSGGRVSDGAGKRPDRQHNSYSGDGCQPGDRASRDCSWLLCLAGLSYESLVLGFRHEIGDVDPSEI